MNLKDQLTNDMKAAMKSGDSLRKDTIRGLRGAIRNAEIDSGTELSDAEVLQIIGKQAKQRRDSIEQYQQANRADLVAQEEQELAIIEAYLPQQLTDEEITARAQAVIDDLGVSGMSAMGSVMKELTAQLQGQADGKRISLIVRSLLSQ